MTRDELLIAACGSDEVSVRINQKVAKEIGKALVECIGVALRNGEEMSISGFGKLWTEERPARVGRNPRSGEPVDIPAKRVIKFKAAAPLKKSVA